MNYEGFAIKETGYNHICNNIVCQDNVQYIQDTATVAAAVSDGHGSKQYFRSDIGSKFASRIACRKMSEFLNYSNFLNDNEKKRKEDISQLINSIVTEWRIAVREHISNHPITSDELEGIPEKYRNYYISQNLISDNVNSSDSDLKININHSGLLKAYGATLICIGICENYGVGLHIGDGKCVEIMADGSTSEPIPWDDKCHLNLCTSICDEDAISEFRYCIWEDKLPIAVFAASDGIDDTFAGRLHSFYRNISLDMANTNFREYIAKLQGQLPIITQNGSHDDVSIVGIVNCTALKQSADAIKNFTEREALYSKRELLTKKLEEFNFSIEKYKRMLSNSEMLTEGKKQKYEMKMQEMITQAETIQIELDLLDNKNSVQAEQPSIVSDGSDTLKDNSKSTLDNTETSCDTGLENLSILSDENKENDTNIIYNKSKIDEFED